MPARLSLEVILGSLEEANHNLIRESKSNQVKEGPGQRPTTLMYQDREVVGSSSQRGKSWAKDRGPHSLSPSECAPLARRSQCKAMRAHRQVQARMAWAHAAWRGEEAAPETRTKRPAPPRRIAANAASPSRPTVSSAESVERCGLASTRQAIVVPLDPRTYLEPEVAGSQEGSQEKRGAEMPPLATSSGMSLRTVAIKDKVEPKPPDRL